MYDIYNQYTVMKTYNFKNGSKVIVWQKKYGYKKNYEVLKDELMSDDGGCGFEVENWNDAKDIALYGVESEAYKRIMNDFMERMKNARD